jgi:hypothetical protein
MDYRDQAFRRCMIWLHPPPLPLSCQEARRTTYRKTERDLLTGVGGEERSYKSYDGKEARSSIIH